MLRSQQHKKGSQPARRAAAGRGLLVFTVGGQPMAARMEDIVEVLPWQKAIAVPSDTPWVTGMVKREKGCIAVYDLAAKLHRPIEESDALCLVVKHQDGPMAICIDATIPALHMVSIQDMRGNDTGDTDVLGFCSVDGRDIPVLHATQLGKTHAAAS